MVLEIIGTGILLSSMSANDKRTNGNQILKDGLDSVSDSIKMSETEKQDIYTARLADEQRAEEAATQRVADGGYQIALKTFGGIR
ncbi:MAG: hypothetical protein DRJ64_10670 [Thermoprotei archaeon]|nr:MAG: hypothetical protein DRJ64_10670 [Thermoprotei archaeon]